jgi:hypothetical protein
MNKIISSQTSENKLTLDQPSHDLVNKLPELLKSFTKKYPIKNNMAETLKNTPPIEALYILYHLGHITNPISEIDSIANLYRSNPTLPAAIASVA